MAIFISSMLFAQIFPNRAEIGFNYNMVPLSSLSEKEEHQA